MKLRVTLCAAVLLSGAAASAQLRPWPFGLYDKLQPHDSPVPKPPEYSKPYRPVVNRSVVFVPKKVLIDPHPIGYPIDMSARANYFKFVPPKSNGH